MTRTESLPRRIAEAARALEVETGAVDTMELAIKLAVDVVEGAEEASISVVRRHRIVDTPAYTGERARVADQIQYDLKQGPLVNAVWDEDVMHEVASELIRTRDMRSFAPSTADRIVMDQPASSAPGSS